ncbi:MAG: RNA polymerase sigma factor [Acidimicrobiales bacterium]
MQLTQEPALATAPASASARRQPQGLDSLVVAARAGSVGAFERIYRSLASQVVSYLRWHRVSDPDGLTNDVFAQVHRKLGSFEGDEQGFRSWVFTIAHHRMIDDRRRAHRQPVVDAEAKVDEHRSAGDVEDDAFAMLGSDRVRELLGVLSVDQRAVVLLRVVADLSVEEVAHILDKREGAVKALQHRAMNALRRYLDRDPTLV